MNSSHDGVIPFLCDLKKQKMSIDEVVENFETDEYVLTYFQSHSIPYSIQRLSVNELIDKVMANEYF
jgi:hypothetical protein